HRVNKRTHIFKLGKYSKIFVANTTHERAVKALAICGGNFRRVSQEIVTEVIATALIAVLAQALWTELPCTGTDDTRWAWIRIGSNHKRVNIEWGSCDVGR